MSTDFSYSEVGGTRALTDVARDTTLPGDYRVIRLSQEVGYGSAAFEGAAKCLLSLDMHRGAGFVVEPDGASALDSAGFTLTIRFGLFRLRAPCRVVYLIDDERSRGFAYGTLPGHPESGEVRFEISIEEDQRVRIRIVSFSRPVSRLVRLAAPIARLLQDRANQRYIAAISRAIADDASYRPGRSMDGMMTAGHRCPVCGYADLHDPPRSLSGGASYEICPSCGFEFGVSDDDIGYTFVAWRREWVTDGMPWRSSGPTPEGWDPAEQLRTLQNS